MLQHRHRDRETSSEGPKERPSSRWKDNIEMDLKELRSETIGRGCLRIAPSCGFL
jgi:hypothetical protein